MRDHTTGSTESLRAARSGIAFIVPRAADVKPSDSPVTIPGRRFIQILDSLGRHVEWADDARARHLLHTQQGEPLFNIKGRLRAIRCIDYQALIADGPPPRKRRYSHNFETLTNPRGCWTLVRLAA